MTYITHALGGAIAGVAVTSSMAVDDKVAVAAVMTGAVLGSLLPDIDHTRSKISKSSAATQVASYAVAAVTKHRGFFHTPLFIVMVAALLSMAIQFSLSGAAYHIAWLAYIGLIPGMLSHLLLDTCNPGGIMWLYPIKSKRFSLLPIKTSSLGEMAVTIILAGILAVIYGADITGLFQR